MSETTTAKTITLQPSWKRYFFLFLFSVLTIPLFGVGLIGLYLTYKKYKATRYEVSDDSISSIDQKYRHNIDLVSIEAVKVVQSRTDRWFDIGDIILQTSASKMVLGGMAQPHDLKNIIEKAVKAEQLRLQEEQKTIPDEPTYRAGSMERLNYLTGLWQQGLLSNEDYEKERKYFE